MYKIVNSTQVCSCRLPHYRTPALQHSHRTSTQNNKKKEKKQIFFCVVSRQFTSSLYFYEQNQVYDSNFGFGMLIISITICIFVGCSFVVCWPLFSSFCYGIFILRMFIARKERKKNTQNGRKATESYSTKRISAGDKWLRFVFSFLLSPIMVNGSIALYSE